MGEKSPEVRRLGASLKTPAEVETGKDIDMGSP